MTRAEFRRILIDAPSGSKRFKNAVLATMDTMSDQQFKTIMRRRDRLHEAALRAKLRPLTEPKEPRVPMKGRKIHRRPVGPSPVGWQEEVA